MLPVMLQRWHEISFFHWSCAPSDLYRRLPKGLEVDTCDQKAWISLTPFLLLGLRPVLTPRFLGLNFPEMNLRTYVVGPEGPGIWFFSLDAASRFAVAGARWGVGLPYYHAAMSMDTSGMQKSYSSRRRDGTFAEIKAETENRIIEQSDLDLFLTARFRLYSIRSGKLITVEVEHAPWELNCVRVLLLKENVRDAMGLKFESNDFLAHHSEGVDTKIAAPHRV